jgi:hypothetical protein
MGSEKVKVIEKEIVMTGRVEVLVVRDVKKRWMIASSRQASHRAGQSGHYYRGRLQALQTQYEQWRWLSWEAPPKASEKERGQHSKLRKGRGH